MSLSTELQSAMQVAMKKGDGDRVRTLRTLLAKLKEGAIEKRADLQAGDAIKVLQTSAKQRKEAAEMYEKGGREELAEAEMNELAIIEEYLPAKLSEDDLVKIVETVIDETGAETMRDMGKVMPEVMKRAVGQADGRAVQELVKRKLSG